MCREAGPKMAGHGRAVFVEATMGGAKARGEIPQLSPLLLPLP
jgi:hypothetical protein